jgi:hypothetical protein
MTSSFVAAPPSNEFGANSKSPLKWTEENHSVLFRELELLARTYGAGAEQINPTLGKALKCNGAKILQGFNATFIAQINHLPHNSIFDRSRNETEIIILLRLTANCLRSNHLNLTTSFNPSSR